MSKIPDMREVFDPPEEIIQAGLNGKLVLFIGSGISMLLGLPSWNGLADKTLDELVEMKCLNYSEKKDLENLDPKTKLSIALMIAENCKIKLNFKKYLSVKNEGDSIYKAINDTGCPCVTTNYDELLAPRYSEPDNKDSTTAAPIARIIERERLFPKLLNEPGTVVHLHGAISNPDTMILATEQYLEHYNNKKVQGFLKELFKEKTILFLGYGLEETEILEHILRKGSVIATNERRRFALQAFFSSQKSLYDKLHDYYEKCFGVHLLGVLRDHEDYKCIEKIVKNWSRQIKIRKPLLVNDVDFMNEVLSNG